MQVNNDASQDLAGIHTEFSAKGGGGDRGQGGVGSNCRLKT